MHHPSERFAKIELICLLLAIVIAIITFVQSSMLWLFITLYLLAISLICDGLVASTTHYQLMGIKQMIRGILLFLLTTLLLFTL